MKIRLWALVAGIACCCMGSMAQEVVYVSPEGKDQAAGTEGDPVGSLLAALERVRGLSGSDTAYVRIASGAYLLEEPILLTEGDVRPVVFEGDAADKPLLSGGLMISGWETTPEGWWKCKVPEVVRYGARFEQLFVNGKRAVRARTPDTGWLFLEKAEEQVHFRGTTRSPEYASQTLYTTPESLASLQEVTSQDYDGIVATFYHKWDITRKRIDFFQVDSGLLCISGKGMTGWNPLGEGTRFVLENYKGALSARGEWFLSRDGELFYIPREGETIETAVCFAPVLEQLVEIKGKPGRPVRDKVFRNLSFAHSASYMPSGGNDPMQAAAGVDAAILLDWAENILFEDCEVRHTGNYAFWFRQACYKSAVRSSFLYDLGAGGIKIGEPERRDDGLPVTGGISVENNIIRHAGFVYPCGVGVVVFNAAGNRILHNEIADLRYTGVSLGWMWGYTQEKPVTTYLDQSGQLEYKRDSIKNPAVNNEVAYNHIHHIGWGELSDMGAVYTLGESPGTHIHHNVVHDIYSYDYGGWGLYTDEGSSDIVLENNLVYACKSGGFHQHYGRNNIIRNNIFAWGHYHQLQLTRVEEHRSFSFTNNIILMDCGVPMAGAWDKADIEMSRNCYWDIRQEAPLFLKRSFKEWRKLEDKGSILADPMFKDPLHADFTFRSLKTARKIGFVPFDYQKAGVYGSDSWKEKARMPKEEIDAFKQIIQSREKIYSRYYAK